MGCVNAPSSHYNTYLTCLSATGVGFIYLQLSLQVSHFLRCLAPTLLVINRRPRCLDFHVALPSATSVRARLLKILQWCLVMLGEKKKRDQESCVQSGMPQIVVWLNFSPTLTFDGASLSTSQHSDLMNSPLICLMGPSVPIWSKKPHS